MEYPLNPEKVILALETEFHTQMEPELKELWECLIPLLNEAYECGCRRKTYYTDWVKKWITYYGSNPDSKMKRLLELTDSIMNRAYEEGRRDSMAAPARLRKAGVPA